MQGWKKMIPAHIKTGYINALLQVGFHTLDMGSFVSQKLVPQMADTAEVIPLLDNKNSGTGLLTIVANERGARTAVSFSRISYLGFPFSISTTFQQRNANSTPEESLLRVKEIQALCAETGKKLVVYMSMGFGNPYGDPYDADILCSWMEKIAFLGVDIISVADTVGLADAMQVSTVMNRVLPLFPGITIGVHLHSAPDNMLEKLSAAYDAGCRRFDGAINGIGGCPMANDELVGNMDTIKMVQYFKQKGHLSNINMEALEISRKMALDIFTA